MSDVFIVKSLTKIESVFVKMPLKKVKISVRKCALKKTKCFWKSLLFRFGKANITNNLRLMQIQSISSSELKKSVFFSKLSIS